MVTRPRALTLQELAAGVSGEPLQQLDLPQVEIRRVVVDSRDVTPGSLFVALPGEHHDGHEFVTDAVSNGAVAVITERVPPPEPPEWAQVGQVRIFRLADCFCFVAPSSLFALQRAASYWRRRHEVQVVGVTGSVGKTTTKEAVAAVLRQHYHTLKSEGNYNNEIGLPLTLLHLTSAHERVVLELGMYGLGEIAQLAEISQPRIGVVTNVGPVHMERLGSLERIAQAKVELPQALPSSAEGGVAILNADDSRVMAMAPLTRARVFSYGLTPGSDLWADEVESRGLDGIHLRFHHGAQTIHAGVPMLGRHSVHTALGAAAVGIIDGLSWTEIVTGLLDQTAQLRLVTVPGPRGSILLDDTYNASPASSIAALNLLEELEGRRIAVLGDMYELGSYEDDGHRIVGRRARDVAHILVTVGRLGRVIGQEALDSGMNAGSVYLVETNAEAARLLQTLVESGDIVLIKGSRGLKMEEIVGALSQRPQGSSPVEEAPE